jgi:hypothetical protein
MRLAGSLLLFGLAALVAVALASSAQDVADPDCVETCHLEEETCYDSCSVEDDSGACEEACSEDASACIASCQ